MMYQQQRFNNFNSSGNSSGNLGLNLQNASTRSNSPESQNSNQSINEPNLLDMIVSSFKSETTKLVISLFFMLFLQNLLSVSSNKLASMQQQQQQQQFQPQKHMQQQQQQQVQNHHHQQQQQFRNYEPQLLSGSQQSFDLGSTSNDCLNQCSLDNFTIVDMELAKLQNLQRINTLKLLQAQTQQMPLLNQLLQSYASNLPTTQQTTSSAGSSNNPITNPSSLVGGGATGGGVGVSVTTGTGGGSSSSNDWHLDRVAKFYRSSAALCEATCTWSGQLPPRSHRMLNYSPKVFLGGIPWDISEQSLIQIFKPFGSIR